MFLSVWWQPRDPWWVCGGKKSTASCSAIDLKQIKFSLFNHVTGRTAEFSADAPRVYPIRPRRKTRILQGCVAGFAGRYFGVVGVGVRRPVLKCLTVIDSLFNTLFRCSHRRTTFPLTQARTTDADASEIYVVCLDCGKQFVYDWEHMRIAKPVDIAAGSSAVDAEAPRIPFKTKRTLRYLGWASAVSAAWVVGRAVKSRRRSQLSNAQSASSQAEAQSPKTNKVEET